MTISFCAGILVAPTEALPNRVTAVQWRPVLGETRKARALPGVAEGRNDLASAVTVEVSPYWSDALAHVEVDLPPNCEPRRRLEQYHPARL